LSEGTRYFEEVVRCLTRKSGSIGNVMQFYHRYEVIIVSGNQIGACFRRKTRLDKTLIGHKIVFISY
jgi:hypothetical protein